MADDLKIKLGIEIDDKDLKRNLQSTLNKVKDTKLKLDFDTTNFNKISKEISTLNKSKLQLIDNKQQQMIKDTNKSLGETEKSISKASKESSVLYRQRSNLMKEEFSIKKKLVSAEGEEKRVLETNLNIVRQKQNLLKNQTSDKTKLHNLEQENKLLRDQEKLERQLQQVRAKQKTQMSNVVDNAIKDLNNKGLSTKQIDEYTKRLKGIDKVTLSQVKAEVANVNKELGKIKNKNLDTAKTLKDVGGVVSGVGNAALAVMSPIAALGGVALKTGMNFEYAMAEVQAVSGATGNDMKKLTAKAKEMGETTKYSATQSANALKYMGLKIA